jgi:acid stress chaperone HdeB
MARREAFGRLGLTKDETMRRLLLLLVMLASLGAAVPAQAEKVDLSTVTCKSLLEYNKEKVSLILMWLDGYYKEDDDDPIVDFDKMADNAKKLGEYCGKNPSHNIITAAEKLIAK